MSPVVSELSRHQTLGRYIELKALEVVLETLARNELIRAVFFQSQALDDQLLISGEEPDINDCQRRLWPEDDDLETAEVAAAEASARLLAARMLELVVEEEDWVLEAADDLREGSAR